MEMIAPTSKNIRSFKVAVSFSRFLVMRLCSCSIGYKSQFTSKSLKYNDLQKRIQKL